MKRPTVSATLLTYNNEDILDRCLDSLRWVDEIVVVDSLSTDRSLEIARRYTDHVITRPWPGFASQRNFSKEHCSGEWILWVDSDEVVSPALREEMLRELEEAGPALQGFEVPRCNFYLGRWIRHGGWYPDLSVRLFRSEGHWWGGEEPHAAVQIKGPLKRLRNDLWHFSYASFAEQIRTIDDYAAVSARSLHRRGERFRLHRMLLHPLGRFLKEYLMLQGFRDGMPGLIVVVATMFYVFSKYAKLWELEHISSEGADEDRFHRRSF
jgi:glycosyltransferase involved in cell wall biosynthesis